MTGVPVGSKRCHYTVSSPMDPLDSAVENAFMPSSPIWLSLSQSFVKLASDPLDNAEEKAFMPSSPIWLRWR